MILIPRTKTEIDTKDVVRIAMALYGGAIFRELHASPWVLPPASAMIAAATLVGNGWVPKPDEAEEEGDS